MLHAPAYRVENAGALRQDWPRVPLPPGRAALAASAALGRQVAALLDSETALAGVTQGSLRPELRALGVISRVGGGSLAPDELAITARWGYAGQGGVTMPGKGKTKVQGLDGGGQALDIFLNDVAYWANVPEPVWEYTIGGYQVLKKWLSYRERPLLGRPLTTQEAREFSAIVRRIAALLLLEAELDANYEMVKG